MRPNILLITADQWRGDCLGYMGSKVVQTPNLDRLASRGTAFTQHFVQATPCGPSRACLYTGLYQMTNRVVVNGTPHDLRHDNIALAMRRLGYDPTLFGYTDQPLDPRSASGDDPRLRTYEGVLPGFTPRMPLYEDFASWLAWLKSRGHTIPTERWRIHAPADGPTARPSRKPPVYSADETETAFLTGEFLRWVDEQSVDRPWFAHISFIRPHPPFIVPEPFASMADMSLAPKMKRAATSEGEAARHPLLAQKLKRTIGSSAVFGIDAIPVTDWSDEDFDNVRAVYYGMVSEVDAQIGRLVAGLEAAGMAENTVIVFTSDHGEQLGDRWTLGKFGFFDESYHVPLIIADPRRPEGHGRKINAFSEGVDLMPTILELVGGASPDHLDGQSLKLFVEGAAPAKWRDSVFFEYDWRDIGAASGAADIDQCNLAVIRTKNAKYVASPGMPPLLFDLKADPDEMTDLAADPAHQALRLEMAERLLAFRAEHLDRRLSGLLLGPGGVRNLRARHQS